MRLSVYTTIALNFAYVYGENSELHCHLDPKINAETWASYIGEVGFVFEVSNVLLFIGITKCIISLLYFENIGSLWSKSRNLCNKSTRWTYL